MAAFTVNGKLVTVEKNQKLILSDADAGRWLQDVIADPQGKLRGQDSVFQGVLRGRASSPWRA